MKKSLCITVLAVVGQVFAGSENNIATGLTDKYRLNENVSRIFFNPDMAASFEILDAIQFGYSIFEDLNTKEAERMYGLAYHAHEAVDSGIIVKSTKRVGNASHYTSMMNGRFHDLKNEVYDLAQTVDTLGGMPINSPETLKQYFKKIENITTMANFIIEEIDNIDNQIPKLSEKYGDPEDASFSNREKSAISKAMSYQISSLRVIKKAIVGIKHIYNEYLNGQSSEHVKTMMPANWSFFHK